jgi:hypothetical protein
MLKPIENVRNSIETCEKHVLHIALKGNAHWGKNCSQSLHFLNYLIFKQERLLQTLLKNNSVQTAQKNNVLVGLHRALDAGRNGL